MATTTTNISLTKPVITDTTKIIDAFNDNMDIIDGRFSATYMAVQAKNVVTITGGSITGITDLVVADGGTGVSTLTDGGVLLGSGTGAITAMAVLTDGQMIVGNGTTDPVAESGATLRTSIGVAIGTNVQAYDAGLLSIAALTTAANKMIYTTASDTYTTTDLSAFARTILDDAAAGNVRTTLGLVIGTNVQAWDTQLDDIAALAVTNGNFIVGDGSNWVAESGATARTSIGLGSVENTALSTWAGTTNITTLGTITTGTWSATTIALNKGGTGQTAKTAAFDALSPVTTLGDIIYGNATVDNVRLAGSTSATKQYLTQTGNGSISAAPAWGTIATGDIPDISGTYAVVAQTFYIGTTQVAINRSSGALTLAGLTLTTPNIGTPSGGTLTNCGGTASGLTAGAVTNATFTTALTVDTGTLTLTASGSNNSVLTIGAGASSISGSNTGDQTNISGNAATVTVDATTSDTECFVAIFESASGSLEPQTDATLTYNASTGVLTSTFSGNITGDVTGNADTVTGFTPASGSLTLAGADALTITTTGTTNVTLPLGTSTLVNTGVTSLSSLATIGTVTSGTLSTGAVLADVTMTLDSDADNDIYYRSSSKLTRLATNATGTNKFLMTVSSGAPAWTELTSDHLSDTTSIAMLDETETVTAVWTLTNGVGINKISDTADASSYIAFRRKRTTGDDVLDNVYLGELLFYGWHTDAYDLGATIQAIVDGTPSTDTDMPSRLEFLTSADGSATPTLAMTINSSQAIIFANPLGAAYGGTGVANNSASTITITGNYATTFTVTNTTGIQLPTSGTLATLAGTEELTNKTLTSPNVNEAVTLTTTATRLNYLSSAGGTTGTTSTNLVFSTSPTFVTPALGTPASGTLTSCTIPIGGVTGLGTNVATFLATPSSSNLISAVTGETGTGALTFATSPTFTTQITTPLVTAAAALALNSASNNDITIQPNGTGDTIIYAPSDVVTTVTAAHTMTIAEAGTVLVSCAATPYTIGLPTASGHTGLRYHFVKTDANYFLITLDANSTETFNYENSTSAPTLTYIRLNTYCAEVTIVSDGTNWQVIDEAMGQVPECFVYMNANQSDITKNTSMFVDLNTKVYDIGSNYNIANWVSGTTTGTTANHVIDSGGAFTAAMVNHRIKNTTDTTYTYVTAHTSATDITVRDDIFVNGEGYEIKNSKFIAPVSGKYEIIENLLLNNVEADIRYILDYVKNGISILSTQIHASSIADLSCLPIITIDSLSKDDVIQMAIYIASAGDAVDVYGGVVRTTSILIKLISKD